MERAQRVDEKNGVIFLVMFAPGVLFTLRVMVIKVSKMTHFYIFC